MSAKSIVVATLVALLSVGGFSQLATFDAQAQEATPVSAAKPEAAKPEAAKPEAAKPEAAKPERAKPRGRLPNYYGKVVTEDQRNKIYQVQQSYGLRIEELQAEIAKLEAQMQEEIDAVLSKEQLERIAQLEAEAKARREAAAAKRAAAKKAAAIQEST